jgi:hypothetical protein
MQRMAGKFTDEQIATTLNRLGLRTGSNNGWNEMRIRSARHYHKLPAFDPARYNNGTVTLVEAAEQVGVSPTVVRRLIQEGTLQATQVVPCAPWEIPVEALNSESVRQAVQNIKIGRPRTQRHDEQPSMFSIT